MNEWLNGIVLYLGQLPPYLVYLGLFGGAFLENVAPPIPGDLITVFGAYLVGMGVINFWEGWIITNIGSVSGFYAMFLLGTWLGRNASQGKGFWFFKKENIDSVARWFDRYGYGVIAANRFLSGARSVISISAGIGGMKHLPVILLSLLSSMIWNGALMYAGMRLGKDWEKVISFIEEYNIIVFFTLILSVTAYIIFRRLRAGSRGGVE